MELSAKELKRLSRLDLMELLLREIKRNKELEARNAELEEKMKSREILLSEAGNIAEASLKLSGIFEAAQRAADDYLVNVKRLAGHPETPEVTGTMAAAVTGTPSEDTPAAKEE